ncbi:MAG: hypothetical protein AAFY15_09765, partial [Cyanobacteria bacterium J06648_11]
MPITGLGVITLLQPPLSLESIWLNWLGQNVPTWLQNLASIAFFAGDTEVSAIVVVLTLAILAKYK